MAPVSITLNNNNKVPNVGLGIWKLDPASNTDTIYNAIKAGYRVIDGAVDYDNTKECGEAVNKAISDGIVTRDEIFVVSKLWNNYHAPKNVKPAVEKILADLQLDYIDLLYIHFPLPFSYVPVESEHYPPGFFTPNQKEKENKNIIELENVPLHKTWEAMEELYDPKKGIIRNLGLSNCQGVLIQDLLFGCKIKPQMLQIEIHPYLPQWRLVEWCHKHDIQVTAYSSFGSQSFIELGSDKAKKVTSLLDHEIIKKVASNYLDATSSDVLLQWAIQRKLLVIPKTNSLKRLPANLNFSNKFPQGLSVEDMDTIKGLENGIRFNDPWEWNNMKFPTFI
ncbi:hypothetical protein QEN19_000347 [Hanseniaspora menglaensis]